MRLRAILFAAASIVACSNPGISEESEPRGEVTSAASTGCPKGFVDMLDWMTLDPDLRATSRVASSTSPGTMLYTSVEQDRFWWMKTPQGDTWDLVTYDAQYLYWAATEQAWHSHWQCKPADSTQSWRAARRCAKPGKPADRLVNASSTFRIVSSSEVQHTSGDQGTIFTLRNAGVQNHGSLGALPTLVLDYEWNCQSGACNRLEQYFLTQRYGLVGWKYFEDGAQKAEAAFDHLEPATVPAPMFSCLTPPEYRRVSIAHDGSEANGESFYASIDNAGRFVAYVSGASNLVPGDDNGLYDVFLYDDEARRTIERVSVATDGTEANGWSYNPLVSRDGEGKYVAFVSDATNLVPGDTNGQTDVFVRDRDKNETKLVSVGIDGLPANGPSFLWSLNGNGCLVVFASDATNLVANDTNGARDVFVRNHCTGTTTLISKSSAGVQGDGWSEGASINGDGRFITYTSMAQNLVPDGGNAFSQTYLYDAHWQTTTRISNGLGGGPANGPTTPLQISSDGDARFILVLSDATDIVENDTNGVADVFLYDRWGLASPKRVSVRTDGTQATARSLHGGISADGRFVAFSNDGSDLAEGGVPGGAYLHDTLTGDTIAARAIGGGTPNAGAFTSFPLVSTETTPLAGFPVTQRISLVWQSEASNIVPNDTNSVSDVFLRVVR